MLLPQSFFVTKSNKAELTQSLKHNAVLSLVTIVFMVPKKSFYRYFFLSTNEIPKCMKRVEIFKTHLPQLRKCLVCLISP